MLVNKIRLIIKSAGSVLNSALFLISETLKIDIKFLKFLLVGGINTIFAYCIYALFVTLGLPPGLALFFQYIIGVLWNFKTTGILVFKNHDNRLVFKFILSYVFTFILNGILLKILLKFLNEYLAQLVLVLPVAMVSFCIFKFWVFKSEN